MSRTSPKKVLRQLQEQVMQLNQRVDALGREVEELHQSEADPPADLLVVEEISKDEVRSQVLRILAEKETTDIVELHETIRCDFGVLIEVIQDLRAEGRLTEA
ncbi:MAG TPA: hypothetical protein VGR51_03760 [Thermoplasmata archaeon]|nr:hypothetical protein [Thermoplasmata archaeon]